MGAKYKKIILPLIILIALILRIISLNQSLWLDEAINVLAVKNNSLIDLVTQYARADFHPPGWFILLWGWTKVFGYSEIAVRMPSVIMGVLSIWIVFLLGKKLFSKNVGLVAALLLAVNPLHIYYSQEARMYVMATLAVLINIFLLAKLIKGEKLNSIFLIFSNIFILISDYIAYFIFPAQFIFLLLYKRELIRKWLLALGLAVLSGFWWLPTFLGQLNVGSIASSNLPSWKLINGAFDFKTLPLTFVKFIIGRISLADKVMYTTLLLPVCGLFIFLLWKSVRKINQEKKLLLIWLIAPLVIATVISVFVPIYNYFRVLYVLPAFIILVVLGIVSFKNKFKLFFLGVVLMIEMFCNAVYLFNPMFQREDWKELVNFFRTQNSPTILFESSGTLPPFDYYAKGSLNGKGALKDFPARYEDDVIDLSGAGEDIYLVDYLVQISDPNRLVDKELKDLGYEQTDIKDFTGVGFIYHYVKK